MEILKLATGYLQEKGMPNPRLDAEVLLAHTLGVGRIDLYVNHDRPLSEAEIAAYRRAIAERASGKPVAYITGEREFMSLSFEVTPEVLIPRPETELLVEKACELLEGKEKVLIADVGTGSGAIAVSLAKRCPQAVIYATDLSEAALRVARGNATKHGVSARIVLVHGDLLAPLGDVVASGHLFDQIISNPPYIPSDQIAGLPRDVAEYEPRVALDGGADGLVYYRRLFTEAPPYMKAGGQVLIELGDGQADQVASLAEEKGFRVCEMIQDYAGCKRVAVLARETPSRADECR